MQKIQSYLYPNRINLLADLAGFTVEYTNVYQRTVKIYQGVDNVLEFDIKNADQKRIDLTTVSSLRMNLMDQSGNGLPNSPYTVTPNAPITGISTVVIPSSDLAGLDPQTLKYSVTAVDSEDRTIPLYADSRFSAIANIQLVGSAVPVAKKSVVFDRFSGEINFMGNVINHSSAVSTKVYEAIASQALSFFVTVSIGFVGKIYVEATKDSTISVESWAKSPKTVIFDNSNGTPTQVITNITSPEMPIGDYNFMRVSWVYPDVWAVGPAVGSDPTNVFGAVDKITVTYGQIDC
jgi:hypothetical protein